MDKANKFTHELLVKRAFKWLKNTKQCSIVVSEMTTGADEIPDAIGWTAYRGSILVEAKVSLSDFRADQLKSHRVQKRGMGKKRYYIMPSELGKNVIGFLPDGWGLLLCTNRGVTIAKESNMFDEYDHESEIIFLVSVIRRIGSDNPESGIGVRRYVDELGSKQPRAELFISTRVNEK